MRICRVYHIQGFVQVLLQKMLEMLCGSSSLKAAKAARQFRAGQIERRAWQKLRFSSALAEKQLEACDEHVVLDDLLALVFARAHVMSKCRVQRSWDSNSLANQLLLLDCRFFRRWESVLI